MRRPEVPRSGAHALGDALQLQGIVVGAVMMREIHTRYGRENLGFVWLIAEPLIFCLGVMGLWAAMHGRYERGVPILAFVMTGYLPLTLWRHVTMRAVHCFRANAALLYHRQVRLLDLLLARIVLEFYGAVIAYVVIAFVFGAFGLYDLPKDWGLFYLGWFYFLLFTAAMGLLIGCLTEMYEWVEKLIGPFMYLMLPVCGAFYMVDWLPYALQQWALYLPPVNAFEMIRGGQFGNSVHVYYDVTYETFVCLAMLAVGLILCRGAPRYLVVE